MKLLDLFAGIGGFSLAAHWMGWKTVAFVEKDAFCQKVLRKNFGQDIEIYDDITTFSGKPFRGRVDIVTGGFPCQPFSQAGKQKGTDDDRHLFPQMLRVVAEVRPRWVVAENVRGLLSIESGKAFAEVISSLEGEGYEVITFCIPASAVNAPHKRERIWIIAYAATSRLQIGGQARIWELQAENRQGMDDRPKQHDWIDSDAHNPGPPIGGSGGTGGVSGSVIEGRAAAQAIPAASEHNQWRDGWLEAATRLCRVDDVVPNRVDRLKSLGNAVVPQVVFEIFRAIEATEKVNP